MILSNNTPYAVDISYSFKIYSNWDLKGNVVSIYMYIYIYIINVNWQFDNIYSHLGDKPWVCVVVWIRMAPIGSYNWKLSHQGVEFFDGTG